MLRYLLHRVTAKVADKEARHCHHGELECLQTAQASGRQRGAGIVAVGDFLQPLGEVRGQIRRREPGRDEAVEHHQRGVHGYNYSDFPLWDILLGTFRNPKTWEGETGFDQPADSRYGAMLAFADVNAPIMGENSFGQGTARATQVV